jgi:hypothetical protein
MRMRTPLLALAVITLAGPRPAAHLQTVARPTVADLQFMSGCWRGVSGGGGVIDEYYTPPSENLMLGVSRFSKSGRVTSYEFTTIADRGDSGLVLTARPSTQSPAEFRLTRVKPGLVVWSNPSHDFPQVISYRRTAGDSLTARIEGPGPTGTRSSEWRMGSVPCAGGT